MTRLEQAYEAGEEGVVYCDFCEKVVRLTDEGTCPSCKDEIERHRLAREESEADAKRRASA